MSFKKGHESDLPTRKREKEQKTANKASDDERTAEKMHLHTKQDRGIVRQGISSRRGYF